MRTSCLGAWLGLTTVTVTAWSAEVIADLEVASYAALAGRIVESTDLLQSFCEAELAGGFKDGLWNSEEKKRALAMLSSMFNPEAVFRYFDEAGQMQESRRREGSMTSPLRWSLLRAELAKERDPFTPTAWLFDWLTWRVEALEGMRAEAGEKMLRPTLEYADRIWLAARSMSDLRPISTALNRARAESLTRFSLAWRMAERDPQRALRRTPVRDGNAGSEESEVSMLIEYWSVLNPRPPLLLPGQDAEFKEYAQFRVAAGILERAGFTLLQRPAIAARLESLQTRFGRELRAVEQALDEAILSERSVDEFAEQLGRLSAFTVPFLSEPSQRPDRQQSIPKRIVFSNPTAIDYRDLVSPVLENLYRRQHTREHSQPPLTRDQWLRMTHLPSVRANYDAWHALLIAEATGSRENADAAIDKLRSSLSTFRPAVAQYLERRLRNHVSTVESSGKNSEPSSTPAVADDVTADPIVALIAALEKLPVTESDADIPKLAGMWRHLRGAGVAAMNRTSESPEQMWKAVFRQPGRLYLIALRSRAGLALLGNADANVRIEAVLRNRYDTAIERGEIEEARRVLTIARACDGLPGWELQKWSGEVEAFDLAARTGSTDRGQILRNIIAIAGPQAAGAAAARQFKEAR